METRAVSFFKRLSTAVLEQHPESGTPDSIDISETTIITISAAIREIPRREQRATFHEDLAELVISVDSVVEATGIKPNSVAFQIVRNIISEIRGIVARAKGLLQHEASQVGGISTTMIKPFEHRNKMTIFQPEKGSLSLHTPGLELSFSVNHESSMYPEIATTMTNWT